MKLLKTILIQLIIVVVFAGSMFALNFYTGPIIDANKAGAANDRLNAVMPGGKAYTDITATLSGVPSSVVKVSKENSGKGFVVECTATSDYTSSTPMDIVVGVDATGKICGINLVSHSESLIFANSYVDSFLGKDSALAGVDVYAGSTYSSNAFKGAVEAGLNLLISNDLIKAGVKSDAQILEELIPTIAPGFAKTEEMTASGNIAKAIKAGNDVGFAYIITSGEATYLAVVNAMGVCKVYDVEGVDVTSGQDAVVSEAKAHALANQKAFATAAQTKFGKMVSGATEFTALNVEQFTSVVYAASFTANGNTYYGFYSRSYGFDQMDVYFVLDQNGAIVKMDATTFIFHEEYFFGFAGLNKNEYTNGFVGLNPDTWNEDVAVIVGATMTTNAVKQSTADVFSAMNFVKGGLN